MKQRLSYFLTLIVFFPLLLKGQPKCYFEHYGTSNGLPQHTIMSIVQDRKGFIWASTWDGLSKFDGYNFFSYKLDAATSSQMRSNRIDFIAEDKYGYIWALPYDKEPQRFDPRTEKFTGLSVHKEFAGKSTPTEKITFAPSGKVWIITVNNGCICVLDSTFNIQTYNKSNKKINTRKVYDVYEDKEQNSWIMTDNGLYKENSGSGAITPFFVNTNPAARFYTCLETEKEIWFGSDNGIVHIFDKKRNRFDSFNTEVNSPIRFLQRINNNQIIIATAEKGFSIFHFSNKQLQHYSSSNLANMPSDRILSCYIDKAENIWLELDCIGVAKFNTSSGTMKHFEMKIENKSLSIFPPNFFIFEDTSGRLWVHPRGGGFAYFDPVNDRLMPFFNEPFSSSWRFSNMMHTAFSDKQGNLWLSTRSHGLEKVVFANDIFRTTIVDTNVHSTINNDIKSILEDSNKNLWVSSKGGKIYVYREGKQIGYLCKDGTISRGTPINGFCYCMAEDKEGNFWIGTKGDGIYKLTPIRPLKYAITQFKHQPGNNYSLSSNNIYTIFQDPKGRIWVGTYGGGLNLMDPNQEGRFFHYGNMLAHYPYRSGGQVRIISADRHGNIWVGTTLGLIIFQSGFNKPSDIRFSSYSSQSPRGSGFSGNDIHDICTTHKGETYVATFGGGVNKTIETDNKGFPVKFQNFNKNNGLPSDIALSIQEDMDGKLWITTEGYLTSYNPQRNTFETFSEISRLIQGHNFSEGARCGSSSGNIYIGYSNGFLSIKPDQIADNTFVPYMALTQLRIDNKIVPIGEDSPLKQSIDDISVLELNHKQNSFTIEFAALDYVNPNNISYAYKLEGVDKDWVISSRQHQVTYAKMGAGSYVFHLKSTNSDGRWVNNERTLTIVVHPPFWQSKIAYFLYFILSAGLLYAVLRTIFVFYRLEDKVKLEHQQAEMRTRFFTDISHEIRTPLTMIVSPIENMVEDKNTPSSVKEQLQLVSKNANRMLRMVNQILDFRKLQKQGLNVQKTKIGRFSTDICSNFEKTAEEKRISLVVSNKVGDESIWIDRDGVEKLLFNLLSNAIKYTPTGKSILVDIYPKDNQVALSVTDEGSGMTKEIQNKIFTRFASYNKDRSKPSTGIGLSIVKEVADKHKAKIVMNSEVNKGTSFTILFIKGTTHFDSDTTIIQQSEETDTQNWNSPPPPSPDELNEKENGTKQTILIVEDDTDLRHFIKSSLSATYKVIEAGDGKEAYQLASAKYPDFILSDIMMPEMDGLELLQMIRENRETSHVPFILLTAKTDIDSKLEGLTFGADDYITKPFSVKYLKARIENIMRLRHELFRHYRTAGNEPCHKIIQPELSNEEVLITPQDEQFVVKVRMIVVENIDNSNFVVEDLAREMSMSRTVFFKKLKSLTGLAPIEFIREIKIRHAAEMIKNEEFTIKEIAFMIGFADTKYFTQCFKQTFGCTPSEYRKANESNK